MISVRSPLFLTASLLFFLSGMVGLGYELVWIRKAALVVGSSQMALSTVLTAFFLGLAAGSYIFGNYLRTRRRSPLFSYGLLEAGIGGFALLFPWLFRVVEDVYGAAYPLAAGSGAALFALRFVLLFGLFFVPTVLMGGTLPLLLDGLVDRDASIGSRTSVLYGINILGAVAGVLLASYWAIPVLGLHGTSLAGASVNLAIGAVALVSFARLGPIHAQVERPRLPRFFPAAAFVSGLLAIAYQIAWARYFSLFHTGTVYLTAILLAVYLLALAAGSFLLAPLLARRLRPLRVLSAVQALVPAFALFGLEWWRAAEYRFAIQGRIDEAGAAVPVESLEIDAAYPYFWRFWSETADSIFFAPLFQVALAIFVPVTLIGAGLPSIIAAAAERSSGLRSVSGRLLFFNTVGSSLGGFIAGYLLLPALGLHGTLALLGLGSVGLALAAHLKVEAAPEPLPLSRAERRRRERGAAEPPVSAGGRRARAFGPGLVPAAVGIAAIAAFAAGRSDVTAYTIRFHGYGRDPELGFNPDDPERRDPARGPALDVIEGPVTTSFLFEDAESLRLGSGNVCLAAVYKNHLSSQALQGHLPCLFYPGSGLPRDCLGLCLGSGQSFGALLLYPIERLDVVDISPEIVRFSLARFGPYNHGLGESPKVRIHLDDGRHFVERAAADSYDVVSMEPPPPTAEGVSSLYSVEFYEEVARVLRSGGVFMQWLPLYRVSPLDARGIVKTQAKVFPDTFVVKAYKDDFMVLSYERPPRFSLDAIRERVRVLEGERLVKGSRWNQGCRHDIASLEGVLAFLIMGPEDIRDMDAPVVYRDDNQILSYTSGDREILRRYEGPALSPLSFAALRLTPFARLREHFEPPLDPVLVEEVERERAAALAVFGVPDPAALAARERALEEARGPLERAEIALELASAYDRMLAKDAAYARVAIALEALRGHGGLVTEEHKETVRAIVRHGLSPLADATRAWLVRLGAAHGSSPLYAAMRGEWLSFREREAKRLSGYLFGRPPPP